MKELSRRDFLKLGSFLAGSLALAACTPEAFRVVATQTPLLGSIPTERELPTATQSPPEEPSNVWELSLAQRVELIASPKFFTELQGKNTEKIITPQFDSKQYTRMNRKAFPNNHCGQATLTTIAKMCEFLNTGNVPDITVADIDGVLDAATFTDVKGWNAKYINWDDEMYFIGLPDALKLLIPELISKTEFLTPNYGARDTRIVPQTLWPDVLLRAQTICEAGGFTVIGGLKYGSGHIVLGTDINTNGTAMVIDSFEGTAERVLLDDYFDFAVDPEAQFLGKQPGLLNMIGVTPKLDV